MANYVSKDAKYSYGGTDITALVLVPVTFSRDQKMEDVTPYGASDMAQLPPIMRSNKDIPIEGLFSETLDGYFMSNFVNGTAAAFVITYGGTKTSTVALTYVKTYERLMKIGAYTRARAILSFSGAVVEA